MIVLTGKGSYRRYGARCKVVKRILTYVSELDFNIKPRTQPLLFPLPAQLFLLNMDSGGRDLLPSQKLRNACDTCSASKLRCGSEKPTCSRCSMSNSPCSYSPTRRVAKSDPARGNRPSRKKPRPARSPLKQQHVKRPGSQNSGLESNALPDEGQSSQQPDPREKTIKPSQGPEYGFESDIVLNSCGSVMSQNWQMGFPQTAHSISPESYHARPIHHVGEDTVDVFTFNDREDGANSLELNGSYRQPKSSNDSRTLHPNISNRRSSSSIRNDHISEVLAFAQGSASNPSEHDCAMLALDMLQDLNTKTMWPPTSAYPAGESEKVTIESLLNTTSIAMKRVSTILVCPCSQKIDVGLLAATICAKVLDIYEMLLRDSTTLDTPYSYPHTHSYATMPSTSNMIMDVDPTEDLTHFLPDGPSDEATMRILERLPKMANLVTQFSTRYGQDDPEPSLGLLSSVAGSLRSRLEHVTDEATNWLANV